MEVSKIRFEGCFWKTNGFHFPKIFSTFWIFSPNKVNVNNGIFSKYYHPFPNFCEKLKYPFRNFPLKYDPKTWHTPMYSSYESPPPPPPRGKSHFQNNELFHKIAVFCWTWYSAKSSYSAKSRYSTKSSYFHKIAVFCKTQYSVKSSYSDITHFLCSACIPQSPVSHFNFLLSSK